MEISEIQGILINFIGEDYKAYITLYLLTSIMIYISYRLNKKQYSSIEGVRDTHFFNLALAHLVTFLLVTLIFYFTITINKSNLLDKRMTNLNEKVIEIENNVNANKEDISKISANIKNLEKKYGDLSTEFINIKGEAVKETYKIQLLKQKNIKRLTYIDFISVYKEKDGTRKVDIQYGGQPYSIKVREQDTLNFKFKTDEMEEFIYINAKENLTIVQTCLYSQECKNYKIKNYKSEEISFTPLGAINNRRPI